MQELVRTNLQHMPQAPPRRRAFTTTELLVTIAIAAVLITAGAIAVAHAQKLQAQSVCAANLRSISIAFQSYTMDNAGRYPQPSVDAQWEDLLRVYIHRPSFDCPGDQELFPALGSSYDWRDTADPATSLAGRTINELTRGDISLTYEALPGWHQPKKLQAAYVDGSVRMVDDEPFLWELQTPAVAGHE